ncbi:MAG: hypothetical protein AB1744_00885 [Candidatus Zixiibacteriota bacterium]
MPKTHRDVLRRTLAQAYINLNWSGLYLEEIISQFQSPHPDLADILETAQKGILIAQEFIDRFAKEAWSAESPDWNSWAATGRPRHGLSEKEV